jgi:purine-nucleoside phosphorylase
VHDHPTDRADPWQLVTEDAAVLTDRLGTADSAVVLGSGWSDVGRGLGAPAAEMPMQDLAGVPEPTVLGHGGIISVVEVGARRVFVLAGRVHLYEGHSPHTVVHAVRCAVTAGCRRILLTNAAGSLRPEVGIGTPVVITDQLNLSGSNPLVGPSPPESLGARFADLTDLYDPALRLRALASDPVAVEGVYAGLLGGSFETPAEIRMLAGLGADVVGMSTVLEAIAARHLGASVFGVSLVTNLAAGLQPRLDHLEVLAAGADASQRLVGILRSVIEAG